MQKVRTFIQCVFCTWVYICLVLMWPPPPGRQWTGHCTSSLPHQTTSVAVSVLLQIFKLFFVHHFLAICLYNNKDKYITTQYFHMKTIIFKMNTTLFICSAPKCNVSPPNIRQQTSSVELVGALFFVIMNLAYRYHTCSRFCWKYSWFSVI